MKIYKFIGRTLQDAILQMRRELGENAIVLSSQTIYREEQPHIEITAGVESSSAAREQRFNPEVKQYVEQLVSQFRSSSKHHPEQAKEGERAITDITDRADTENILPIPPSIFPSSLATVWRILIANDFSPYHLHQIFRTYFYQLIEAKTTTEQMLFILKQLLYPIHFTIPKFFDHPEQTHRVLIVGPSGCGKTTVIAKLSALLHQQQRAVQILTTDFYKADSSSLLQLTARLFRFPFVQFHTPQEIHHFLEQHHGEEPQTLLIDTPGWNIGNATYRKATIAIYQAIEPTETLLLLPAPYAFPQLRALIQQYTPLAVSHYIITKLDEAVSLGPLFSLLMDNTTPVAFFSTGSEIPDDIEIASSDFFLHIAKSKLGIDFSGEEE